jgi:hypothetical protein
VKCSALLNMASHSMASANVSHNTLQTCLIVLNGTRWNSFNNSVDKDLLDKTPDDVIIQVFHALDVNLLSVKQENFIQEYCSVMQPLAHALDILQGEKNMYIGYLLLTMVSLEKI